MAPKSDYTSRSKYQFIENKGGGHVKPHHWYANSSVLTVENYKRQTIPFLQQIKCKELKKNLYSHFPPATVPLSFTARLLRKFSLFMVSTLSLSILL